MNYRESPGQSPPGLQSLGFPSGSTRQAPSVGVPVQALGVSTPHSLAANVGRRDQWLAG